ATQAVDGPVARRGGQPGARVRGLAGTRPALGRDRERLLSGLLGEVEVAEEADQVGEDAAPLVAKNLLDQGCGYPPTMGLPPTAPPMRAAGMRAASSSAPSRLSASTR